MKVLVTGASGFVAPHVAKHLTELGHEVILADINREEGDESVILADLTSLGDMLDATQGIDGVCHLGGVGDVYLAATKPYVAASANVLGTANLLEACSINGVKKVVYASTWEVYGEPEYQPMDEKHPCNPDHPYNITKLAGERLAMAYDHMKELPAVALRLGTAYGAGMRPNSVFSRFIIQGLNEEPITIAGTGEQTRQFTHASDIARAFALALESDVHGEVFNAVAEEVISIRQLAELVTSVLPTKIEYLPARAGDVPPALINSTKAREVLGWSPATDFKTGLFGLIEHIKVNSHAAPSHVLADSPSG